MLRAFGVYRCPRHSRSSQIQPLAVAGVVGTGSHSWSFSLKSMQEGFSQKERSSTHASLEKNCTGQLYLGIGAFFLLAILSMSYGDVTEPLEDKSCQRLERSVTVGWWLWWGINAGILGVLLYRLFKRYARARQ